jgi:hypothetical protein
MKPTFSNMTEMVKAIADPHDHKPMRLPTFPDVERTSILPFVSVSQAVVPSAGTGLGFVIRAPAAPVWFQRSVTWNGYYDFRFSMNGLGLPNSVGTSLQFADLLTDPTWTVNNNFPFWPGICQDANGVFWFWAPAGSQCSMMVNCYAVIGGSAFYLDYEYTTSFRTAETSKGTTAFTVTGSTAFTNVTSTGMFWRPIGLYCLTTGNAVTIDTIYVRTFSGGTPIVVLGGTVDSVMPVSQTPPEFLVAPSVYNSCRVNAVSALFQNTTAVLSKEGSVEAVLLSMRQRNNYPLVSSSADFTSITADIAASCRYVGLLEKGMYTFALPDAKCSEFRDCAQIITSNGSSVPLLNLDAFDYVNYFRFTDYSSPATNLLVTIDVHHEFRNTTMLWPIGVSAVPLEEWHKSQVALQGMLPFYENPTHLMAIANLARLAALRLYPYVKPIAQAGLYAARDRLMNMAASALTSRMAKPQVVTTSQTSKQKKSRPRPKGKKASVKKRRS